MYTQYTAERTVVMDSGELEVRQTNYDIKVMPRNRDRLGVMLVGFGGNNGTTLTAGLLAHRRGLTWYNKAGKQSVEFLGSVSQFSSVHVGYDNSGNSHSRCYKEIGDFYPIDSLVVGGWDICGDDLYTAARKAKVIDYDLLKQLEADLSQIRPLPSIYAPDFVATNQGQRANNVIPQGGLLSQLKQLKSDIETFREENGVDKVIVLWTASTERFNKGLWKTAEDLLTAIAEDDPEVPPSVMFAVAAAQSGSIFLNGSPQNTICPAVIDVARTCNTFVGGEDFKTGQTKLKSVLVDWLARSGIRPLSIVSYNHLGNNDGKNLDETPQFRSKEITKKNVIDDVVDENPQLLPDGKPDHAVVIKYIPAVGDSKRAMDEYCSQLFLDGRHNLAIYNTCEDSLLAAPLILDIILFADFFSRVKIRTGEESPWKPFNTVLSLLSLFFKAPAVNDREPLVNAFFKQVHGLENFFRILLQLPTLDYISLDQRL